jgi:hypothetical protein
MAMNAAFGLRWRAPMSSPPGAYASPIPNLAELEARRAAIWGRQPRTLAGIDLREQEQFALLDTLAPYLRDFNDFLAATTSIDTQIPPRYAWPNRYYSKADAAISYALLRYLRPRRVLGVGAGYAASLLLDINERHFGGRIACAFVEPSPRQLLAALRPADRAKVELIRQPVATVSPRLFAYLRANDILFVDGAHLLKTGGDLNALLFEILPALPSGVYIHFHDVGYPFEYAESEVARGRAWNETYALRAFLQYNDAFEIACYVAYLDRFARGKLTDYAPGTAFSAGTSLWLRRA